MFHHGFNREGAGDLSGGLTSHAIREDEKFKQRFGAEAIFVVFANSPDVAARAGFNVQGPPSALLQANKVSVAAQGAREQVVTSDDIYR